MLSYAFQELMERGYKKVATEDFKNVGDLCAEILNIGISKQLKLGLRREYIEQSEQLSVLRGRIEVTETINRNSLIKRQIVCKYDEYSENSYVNRILKTTMLLLISSDIAVERKRSLRKLLLYFDGVDTLNPSNINWKQRYDRNNRTYQMLVSICYLVIKGLLQTTNNGKTRLMDFIDDQRMHHLYEKFILGYYKKEYPHIKASASQIKWMVDDDHTGMLPIMQSDVMLEYGSKVLIIDAKYYGNNLQKQFEKYSIHSGNLYQIFTYVKNKVAELNNSKTDVSGLVLYAKTDAELQPKDNFLMGGNRIGVDNLDLNCEFSQIAKHLDQIAIDYLGVCSENSYT